MKKSHVVLTAFAGPLGFYSRVLFPRISSWLYLEYLRQRVKATDRKFIDETLRQSSIQPRFIHVETINRCNGTCPFCPCNKNEDTRPFQLMDADLVYKIIDDLAAVEYDGILMLSANCEPFMDKRIPDFIRVAREKLPKAQHILFTNGTLITDEVLGKIAGQLDTLYVNNYNARYQLTESSKAIYHYVKTHENDFGNMTVQIEYRYANEVLTNKGGKAPNKKNDKKIYHNLCPIPFLETIIFPDGTVGLCCNDNDETTNYGNVKNQHIFDIYNGEPLTAVRQAVKNGRSGYPFCQYCDFVSKSGRRERWIKTGRD